MVLCTHWIHLANRLRMSPTTPTIATAIGSGENAITFRGIAPTIDREAYFQPEPVKLRSLRTSEGVAPKRLRNARLKYERSPNPAS